MANWSTLKTAVANIINTNGNQAITGQLLQNVLNNIITNVGENATFAGIATLTTNPGAPDGPVFYLATAAGTYANFNGIEVSEGEAVILQWNNGAWSKKNSGFATQKQFANLKSVRSNLSIFSYESINPSFTIDYTNKKLIVDDTRIIITDSCHILYDSSKNRSYETDFVGDSASPSRIAFIVFNIEEEKLYFVDFAKISSYPEFDSETGNRKNINLGSIIRQYSNKWGIGFNFAHIKINGKDYYGEELEKAKTYTDEKIVEFKNELNNTLKGYATEKVIERGVSSNSMVEFDIPQVVGSQFYARVECENLDIIKILTCYIIKGQSEDNNFRSIQGIIRKGNYMYITAKYTEEDLIGDRNKFRLYFNEVTELIAVRIVFSTFPAGIINEKQEDLIYNYISSIRPILSISSYDTKEPAFSLDWNTKKLSAKGRILISDSHRLVADTGTLEEPYETDFIEGNYSNPAILSFIVYNIGTKKLHLVAYNKVEGLFPEIDKSTGARLNVYVGSIMRQHTNTWCFGFNFAHIKVNGQDFYGDVTAKLPWSKSDVSFFPIIADDVDFIEKTRTENLFNKNAIVKGWYGNDGIIFQESNSYWCSDFIAVEEGVQYRSNRDSSFYIYCYDANKNVVKIDGKSYWQPNVSIFTIPEGVSYIRKLFNPESREHLMITLGSVSHSVYIPYYTYELSEEIQVKDQNQNQPNYSVSEFGISDVGNVKYQEIAECDYAQVIMYGQSLSMGWEAPEAIVEPSLGGVYMVGDKVAIRHGNNGSSTLNPLVSTMATSCGENPTVGAINAFVPMYRRFMGRDQKFIATSCGEGGKSIEQMSKESTNGTNWYNTEFMTALNRTKAAVDTEGKTVGCFAILYMQGEYNYVNLSGAGLTNGTDATNDKDTYKAYLKTLKDNMQADIMATYGQKEKPLFLIYEVAGSYINRFDMSINMAQVEFAMENDDVFLLPPTYPVPDYGGGHLSTNGYRWYGEMIAKSLYNVFVRGKRFYPIMPQKFTIKGKRLRIDFFVPVMPLVFDTWTKESITNMGFRVQVNDADVTISAITIENNAVVIECASELTGKVAIAYAGQGRSGSGNLRDSDTWRSYYTYYDDTESSPNKRENYTPLDAPNGNKIYGKPYPMYNWCGNFYKLIQEG